MRDQLHVSSPQRVAINTLVGMSLDEIQAELVSTSPDPAPAQYLHLRPGQRYKLVILETEFPDRPGYLRAANIEGNIYTHGALGYVREQDWAGLAASGNPAAEIPMFDLDGEALSTISLGDLVLGPSGLMGGQ